MSFEGAAGQHIFAALVEPFVTKFFPALALVMLASRPRGTLPSIVQQVLQPHPFGPVDSGTEVSAIHDRQPTRRQVASADSPIITSRCSMRIQQSVFNIAQTP